MDKYLDMYLAAVPEAGQKTYEVQGEEMGYSRWHAHHTLFVYNVYTKML